MKPNPQHPAQSQETEEPVLVLENRRIGFLEGHGRIGPEFFDPLPEYELRLWNGKGD